MKRNILSIILISALMLTMTPAYASSENSLSSEVIIPDISGWDVNVMTNESKLWINEANFPDTVFRQYILDNFDKDGNGYLGYPEILEYDEIRITNNTELKNLDGIWYFEGLRALDITGSSVSQVPVQALEYLQYLILTDSPVKSLDTSSLQDLRYLWVSNTGLTSLDLSQNTQLSNLACDGLGLTSIDVSGLKELTQLSCSDNELTELDVSKNAALKLLYCSKNQLTSLDLTSNTVMETINWDNNPLLAVICPKNFVGSGASTGSYAGTLELMIDEPSGTIDLSQYAPGIQMDRISDLENASIQNGTTISPYAGHKVSYKYYIDNNLALKCSFLAKSPSGKYYITASSVKVSGTSAKASIGDISPLVDALRTVANIKSVKATKIILDLKSSEGTCKNTTANILGAFFTALVNSDAEIIQAVTDHGVYELSKQQFKAIGKLSKDDYIKITFSTSEKTDNQVILLANGTSDFYLNGQTISSEHPDEMSAEQKEPSSDQTVKNQKLIAGIQKTKLTLKNTVGKRYIKLNWSKSPGYKVDYYEVFRSVKKNSGYGTKPFYKTSSGNKCSYKNTKSLKKGTRYYFKVRGVRVIDGKKYYTQWSNKSWNTAK